ncbi:MAG TPA: TetR family transcriptional regulator [Jatrophihabitans sp.]|nr:TetR family transcriptional regulator [Jatrophihabitans sp.]
MSSGVTGRSRGRPRGQSNTRETIAEAARRQFARNGYDRTTMRTVAAEAGVDPALVVHFFGSKQRLFVSVLDLPFDPAVVLPAVLAGNRRNAGRRLAEFVADLLEDPAQRDRLAALVRAAASEPAAADLLRSVLAERVYPHFVAAFGAGEAELRQNLIGSVLVGLVMTREVARLEPIASLGRARLVEVLAPVLQRFVAGSL